MDSRAPNERSTIRAVAHDHVYRDLDVFAAIVTADTTRTDSRFPDRAQEDLQDRFRTIVV